MQSRGVGDVSTSDTDGGWRRSDLIARLQRCLEVASRAVELLAPAGYKAGDDEDAEVSAEKIIAETGLLLLVSAPAVDGNPLLHEVHTKLARRLIPFARSDRIRAGICLMPARAVGYATAHICLTRLGYPDNEMDHLLSRSLTASVACSGEAAPHRQMEHDWLRQLADPSLTPTDGRKSSLGTHSILACPVDLLSATRSDTYAFTHALMFLTQFGLSDTRVPRAKRQLAADAESLLAGCLDDQDYDLCAELLLTWPLLRLRWSAGAAFGFSVLTGVEDIAGFLPSPMTRLDRYAALGVEGQAPYALATAYHAVYAMGLLCAVALHPGPTPPAGLPRSRRRQRGAAAAILELLDEDMRVTHWREHMTSLSSGQDAIAPLLLTMLLRRAMTRKDMGAVNAALRIAERYDVATIACAQQAQELLCRVTAL